MELTWIAVQDQLPASSDDLCWIVSEDGKQVTLGYCYQGSWSDVWGEDDGLRSSALWGVTHWAMCEFPLPPPPIIENEVLSL